MWKTKLKKGSERLVLGVAFLKSQKTQTPRSSRGKLAADKVAVARVRREKKLGKNSGLQ